MTKQVKYAALCICIFLIILLSMVVDSVFYYQSVDGRARVSFNQNIDRLSLGMPMKEINRIMGRMPDYEYRYRSYTIAYFVPPPARWRKKVTLDGYTPGGRVWKLSELPDLYDCVQLAFNSNQLLVAHTRIGESYYVRLANQAPIKGSHFSVIEMAGRDLE